MTRAAWAASLAGGGAGYAYYLRPQLGELLDPNIIRLAANTGFGLHLVEPLGFELDEPRLKRAGLDYREFADVQTHASLADALDRLKHPRLFAFSTRNARRYDEPRFARSDAFLLGPETRGLPQDVLDDLPDELGRLLGDVGRPHQDELPVSS